MLNVKDNNRDIKVLKEETSLKITEINKHINLNEDNSKLELKSNIKNLEIVNESLELKVDNKNINLDVIDNVLSVEIINNPIFVPYIVEVNAGNSLSIITDGNTTVDNVKTLVVKGGVVEDRDEGIALINILDSTLDGKTSDYYLNRKFHTGLQSVDTISGLGNVATKNVGTLINQVLSFTEDNKLPRLDGSLLINLPVTFEFTEINSNVTLTREKNRLVYIKSNLQSFNILLPSNPMNGDLIIFVDADGSNKLNPTGLGLYEVTIIANTNHNIQSFSSVTLDEENTSMSLVFNNNRWTISQASF